MAVTAIKQKSCSAVLSSGALNVRTCGEEKPGSPGPGGHGTVAVQQGLRVLAQAAGGARPIWRAARVASSLMRSRRGSVVALSGAARSGPARPRLRRSLVHRAALFVEALDRLAELCRRGRHGGLQRLQGACGSCASSSGTQTIATPGGACSSGAQVRGEQAVALRPPRPRCPPRPSAAAGFFGDSSWLMRRVASSTCTRIWGPGR